jgi:hypothetical protein
VGFLIVALLAGFRSFSVQRREPVLATLLFLTVVGQVVPFLKYTLFRYYPNHNIAVYLTFVLGAALYVSSLESKVASNATVSLAAYREKMCKIDEQFTALLDRVPAGMLRRDS